MAIKRTAARYTAPARATGSLRALRHTVRPRKRRAGTRPLVADTGVEECIREVDNKIDEDEQRRVDEHDGLDDGVVALQYSLHAHPGHAGDVENHLDDERARQC